MMWLSSLPAYCRSFLTCSRRVRGKTREKTWTVWLQASSWYKWKRNEMRFYPALLSKNCPWVTWGSPGGLSQNFRRVSGCGVGNVREGWQEFTLSSLSLYIGAALQPVSLLGTPDCPRRRLPPPSLALHAAVRRHAASGMPRLCRELWAEVSEHTPSKRSRVVLLRKQKVVQAGRPIGLLSSGWCVLTGGYVSWDEREGSGNSHYSPACWAFWSQWRSHAGRFRVYLQEKNTAAAIDPSRLAGAFRR